MIDSRLLTYPDTEKYEELDKEMTISMLSPVVNLNYNDEERRFLENVIKDFKLSPSAFNEYIECPLKFKFNRLLKMPKATEKVTALGSSIHAGLEAMQRRYIETDILDKDILLAAFNNELKRQLLSKEDKESTRLEGEKILTQYLEHYKDKLPKAIFLEYSFVGKGLVIQIVGFLPNTFKWQDR